jgi:hypothetical protein
LEALRDSEGLMWQSKGSITINKALGGIYQLFFNINNALGWMSSISVLKVEEDQTIVIYPTLNSDFPEAIDRS